MRRCSTKRSSRLWSRRSVPPRGADTRWGLTPIRRLGSDPGLKLAMALDNPIGTDGFEFVEYAAPDPGALGGLFERMGFSAVARHRHKNVLLYKQGDVNFIVNAEPRSFAQNFARRHGPSVCAMAFRVRDAAKANAMLLERGAGGVASQPGPGGLSIPARRGTGGAAGARVARHPGDG